MGDFTRDMNYAILPAQVLAGIQMHQSVDAFTDSHPVVRGLRKNFSQDRRRFSGIVLDVVFDHFLIKHWSAYSTVALDNYITDCYHALWRHRNLMSPRMKMVIGWMISKNWIKTYAEIEGVGRALDGLAGRLKAQHNFHGAISEVENMYTDIEQGFLEFFPQLRGHVKAFLSKAEKN